MTKKKEYLIMNPVVSGYVIGETTWKYTVLADGRH